MLSANVFTANTSLGSDEFARTAKTWKSSLKRTGYWDKHPQNEEAGDSKSEDSYEEEFYDSDDLREMEETFNIPSDEKADIAAKAKKKFLENLHKFQEKTANQTPFRRSYRTADGQAAGMSKHMRRSHRPTTSSQSSGHIRHHFRSSLRKRSTEDPVNHQQRLSNSNSHQSISTADDEDDGKAKTMTSSRSGTPVPGTDQVENTICDSQAPSSGKRGRSRAELAAEKHKDRIRKASTSGQSDSPIQTVSKQKPKRRHSNQSDLTRTDLNSPSQEIQLPKPEELQNFTSGDIWTQPSFMDDSPLKAVIDMLSNDLEPLPNMSQKKSTDTSLLSRQPDDTTDDDEFITADLNKKNSSNPTKIPTSEKSTSANQYKDEFCLSNNNVHTNNKYSSHSNSSNTPLAEEAEFSTKNDHFKPISSLKDTSDQSARFAPLPSAALGLQPETVDQIPSSSKNLPLDTNSTAIDYNAEEAIDIFKRLSHEIDQIKSTGFRQSVSEANFRPKPPAPRSKIVSLSLPIQPVFEESQPESVISAAQELHKPLGKQSEHRHVTDNHISGNSSFTRETNEKERKKKEEKKERNEHFGEKRPQTSVINHLLSESDQEKNIVRNFDQNNHSLHEAELQGNGERIKTESLIQKNLTASHATDEELDNTQSAQLKMSVSIESPPIKNGNSTRFRKMSAAQRREKLRQVVLRHRSHPNSSESEDSLLSDASSNASDIDMSWLEDGDAEESVFSSSSEKKAVKKSLPKRNKAKKEILVSNGSLSNGRATNGDRSESPQASVGNMMAMWETKVVSSSKSTRSSPSIEIEGGRNKLGEAKAVFATSTTPKSPVVRQRRRMSFEKEQNENANDSAGEPRKVGSMLSMWENINEMKRPAINPTEDEALGSSIAGRLKGTKALFENMSKHNQTESIKTRAHHEDGSTSPIAAKTPVYDVKSLFETSNRRRENSTSPTTKRSRKSLASAKSSAPTKNDKTTHSSKPPSKQADSTEPTINLNVDAVSNHNRSRRTRRRREIDDETDSLLASSSSPSSNRTERKKNEQTSNITSRRRRHQVYEEDNQSIVKTKTLTTTNTDRQDTRSNRRRRKDRLDEQKTKEMENSAEVTITPEPLSSPTKSYASKSNIQSKISARKKRDRRPMTQPITFEDVTSAKQLIHNKEPSSDYSSKESENQEEEQLSFSERLQYFNQLIARSKVFEPEENRAGRRHRGAAKRYLTQPIDREAIAQAKELHGNSQTTQLAPSRSEQGFEKGISVELDQINNADNVTETDLNEVKKSVSEADNQDKPKKVGKLPSELKTKFLENQSINLTPDAKPRRSPRQTRRNIPSESSNNSSINTRHQPLRDCSSSPLPRRQTEEDSSSENSDMGKNRGAEIKATGSIHDRLKLLEKNKEEGWKKRLKEENKSVKSSLGDRLNKLQDSEEKWKKNKPPLVTTNRVASGNKANISDRLNSIMANSENWKNKTGKQNDATQFTVQAKIAKRDGQQMAPITNYSVKRKNQPISVADESAVTIDDVASDAPSLNKLSEVLKLSQKGLEPEVIKTTESSTTEIPDIVNEDFENFFSTNLLSNGDVTITNGVASPEEEKPNHDTPAWFDDEIEHTKANNRLSDIGRLKANVKRPSVRNKRSSRNPVKALAARTDVKQSYTEHRSNVSKLEQQRIASRHGFGANFTSGALAGLAAKADLSKVNLRSTKKNPAFSASDHKPWKNKMLLRVKGRRHVQTRLVEPVCSSLNSGDAFLLILPDKLYAWFGEYSNVIEKAKVQEIADYIIHKGDLGSKATSLVTIKEENSSSIRAREFWNLMGGKGKIEPSGGSEEDELYEANAEATIKSYKLEDSKLTPYQKSWGKLPTMGQLSPTSTFVFDFGAEMYVWHGKEVSFEDRQLAIKLAKTLWDQGYDYSQAGFCPFLPASVSTVHVTGDRPEWGLFARVNENLETALVQEKFEDWSNIAREIGDREEVMKVNSRGQLANEMNVKTNIAPDMTSCDVNRMKENKSSPIPLQFEGYNLWKGYGLMYDEDGRGLMVVTNSVSVWHASDKALTLLEDEEKGIFHRGETYVVRWRYVISSTGKWKAETSGRGDMKSDPKGRERVAYFLWTGCDSTVNEKGASALMATEIDKEIGSQVIVTEGKEPPSMCQCFNGQMMVLDGKKGSRDGYYSWRLFCVRGSYKEEAVLYQVPCHVNSLRSRASFIAVHGRQAKVVVWHGAKSPEQTRNIALHAADQIQKEKRTCVGFRLTCKHVSIEACEEENENDDFTEAIGRLRRSKYMSLAGFKSDKTPCPRMWHLTPDKDEFISKELHPVVETVDEDGNVINCFPYTQQQLKELNKPALVLMDNSEGVYLWQSSCDEELTGSSKRQYDISRRLAMETTENYCKNFRSRISPLLVHENHEPIEFSNSFPIWKEPDRKILFEEKRLKKPQPIDEVLKTLCRLTYSLEELRSSPLPEGVDPNHLETYLTASDFVGLFEMSKKEFYTLPPWKQQNLRKEKNLF